MSDRRRYKWRGQEWTFAEPLSDEDDARMREFIRELEAQPPSPADSDPPDAGYVHVDGPLSEPVIYVETPIVSAATRAQVATTITQVMRRHPASRYEAAAQLMARYRYPDGYSSVGFWAAHTVARDLAP